MWVSLYLTQFMTVLAPCCTKKLPDIAKLCSYLRPAYSKLSETFVRSNKRLGALQNGAGIEENFKEELRGHFVTDLNN